MVLVPLSAPVTDSRSPFDFGEPTISTREIEQAERMSAVEEYGVRRSYYDGAQYDLENETAREAAGYADKGLRLPEHLRKHAYSSHIQESIDTLADMLAEGVSFEGTYADELNEWWFQSGMHERVDDWFREALM